MPRAGAVSHRQQAMRIANNMRSSRLDPAASEDACGNVFRISVSKSRLTGVRRAIAGNRPAICADDASGIDLPNGRVAVLD